MAITRLGPNQSVNLASNVTGTLPAANGGTGATSFSPGKVLQVVQAETNTEVANSSTSYADTGLTASITPSSTSNKILILVQQAYEIEDTGGTSGANFQIMRDSTSIYKNGPSFSIYIDSNREFNSYPMNYLDSPSTTSSVTYKTQSRNYQSGDNIRAQASGADSSITLLEIAG